MADPLLTALQNVTYISPWNPNPTAAPATTAFVNLGYTKGYVGIGTTSPLGQLQIVSNPTTVGTVNIGNGSVNITGTSTKFTSAFKVGDSIGISGAPSRTIATILSDTSMYADSAYAVTLTGASYTTSPNNVITTLQNGYVGIGVTNPSTYLAVGIDGDVAGSGFVPGISMKSTSSSTKCYTVGQDATHMVFLKWVYNTTANNGYGSLSTYGGTNNIVLNEAGGRIAVGTTNIISDVNLPLQLSTNNASTGQSYIGINRGTAYGALFGYDNAYAGTVVRNVNSTNAGISLVVNNTTEAMRITGAGNVGIGTINPSNVCEILGANGSATLRITTTAGPYASSNATCGILFTNYSGNSYSGLISGFADGVSPGAFLGGLAFSVATAQFGLTETMRMKQSGGVGFVGIGTTNPNVKLYVADSSSPYLTVGDSNSPGFSDKTITIGYNIAGGYASIQSFQNGVGAKNLCLNPSGGNVGIGTSNPLGILQVNGSNTVIGNAIPNSTYISNSRVCNVYSQTAGFPACFGVDKDNGSASDCSMFIRTATASGTGFYHLICQTGLGQGYGFQNGPAGNVGTSVFQILGNGNCLNANNVYTAISDIRVKENIVDARNYLDDIMKVRVVKYSLIEQHSPIPTHIGVIAQELEKIFPSLTEEIPEVNGNGQNTGNLIKSVKYSILSVIAIKGLQELTQRNTDLTTRVSALEAENASLKSDIALIKAKLGL